MLLCRRANCLHASFQLGFFTLLRCTLIEPGYSFEWSVLLGVVLTTWSEVIFTQNNLRFRDVTYPRRSPVPGTSPTFTFASHQGTSQLGSKHFQFYEQFSSLWSQPSLPKFAHLRRHEFQRMVIANLVWFPRCLSRLFSFFGTIERGSLQWGPGFAPCFCSIIQARLTVQNVAVGKILFLRPLQF